MRGKRFCLFVMVFVAMVLCFMLTGYGARGVFAEEALGEEVHLKAIYDRPAERSELGDGSCGEGMWDSGPGLTLMHVGWKNGRCEHVSVVCDGCFPGFQLFVAEI